MTIRPAYLAVLLGSGMLWGLSQPLGKIAVSTGHGHFGLIFWQMALAAGFLALVNLGRGRGIVLTRDAVKFAVVVAVLGTVVPNSTFYMAIAHLPSGIMSINIAAVPLVSLPIAVALRQDRFSTPRVAGLCLGLAGVILIVAPQGALPAGVSPVWLLIALVGPVFYAFEANYVAHTGTAGMDPVQALFLASVAAAVIALPLAVGSGQFIDPLRPWGPPEWALVATAAVHAVAYTAYVWLASQAGAVFAAQSSYIVTGSGVVWALALLGERYSPWVWAALAVMLVGVTLVQPRETSRAINGSV